MIEPLRPSEITDAKSSAIPDCVMQAANALLAKRWNGHRAEFKLRELTALARELGNLPDTHRFGDGDLDIEIPFRKAGWKVEFDRPGYCETYDAFFVFMKKGGK